MSAFNNNNAAGLNQPGQLNEHHGIAASGLNNSGLGEQPHHTHHIDGKDHHKIRDAGLGAGAAGIAHHEIKDHNKHHDLTHHDNKEHHLGRDTAVTGGAAGLASHEYNKHEDKKHTGLNAVGEKPSVGDKIKGNLEKAVGKVSGNEAKVIEGENIAQGRAHH